MTSALRKSGMAARRASGEVLTEAARARVLLVDDDERNLLALSEVLGDLADIVCADSGEEALRLVLKDRFAVILMDVLMPELDGYETAQLIRTRRQSRETPIIFLTAINKEDAHMLRGYDLGAVDYIFKPFEPTAVRSKVSVFVSLYEKSVEIERKAIAEQRLLRDMLQIEQERTRALGALRQSKAHQALILGALPIAIYAKHEADGPPLFVAGDIKAITGFEATAFATDPELWKSRVHPNDRIASPILNGAAATREFRWMHADGAYRYLLEQSVGLSDGENALAGTLRDVTEQRMMQDQLLQAQKMEAIGKLTGGVAHDFNNLLAAVLSGLNLIGRKVELNESARNILEMTRHAAEQGKVLVSRLVAFSRRQQLAPQVVDLEAISRSLSGMLAPMLGGLVELKWEIEPKLWSAYVDASQLELAIMNLVINARDAMGDGGTVTIRVENRITAADADLASGEYVVVSVRDVGTGIPPDLISKVIEPFFTTKDVGKGSGLGLSMAYGFARQSGGTLRIESKLGIGTSVDIWLPRSRETDASIGEEDTGGALDKRTGRDAHILLVDDSPTLRELTEMHLLEVGYRVTSAPGGAEALALIEGDGTRFDVIVTDFAMPKISGIEVIKRAREFRPSWPAVVITGYADTEVVAERPDGVTVLPKPFSMRALVQAIEKSRGI